MQQLISFYKFENNKLKLNACYFNEHSTEAFFLATKRNNDAMIYAGKKKINLIYFLFC